jgi:hypothetical protein
MQPLEESGARELDEVPEPLVRLGEQRQVVSLHLRVATLVVVDEVGLETHERLDVVLLAGLVELDSAVHHPVIGEREGRLTEARGTLGEPVDLAGAVQQRVLAVDVEVDCGGDPAHPPIFATDQDGSETVLRRFPPN